MKINTCNIFYKILIIFLILQQGFIQYTNGVFRTVFSYIDEICVIIFMSKICFSYKRINKLDKVEINVLKFFFIFLALGVISNIAHPMQTLFLNISDLIVCARFLVFYYAARLLLSSYESERIIVSTANVSEKIVFLLFVLALVNMFTDKLFPKGDYRYFTKSIQLFFGAPSALVTSCVALCVIVIVKAGLYNKLKYKNKITLILACFCIFFTLRTKGFITVIFIAFFYLYFIKFKMKSKILVFIGAFIIATLIGWEQFQFYFGAHTSGRDDFVRAKLLRDSISLANQYFPLGTGFATFGSNIAANNYSPLYYLLGYSNINGASPLKNNFLSDSFWPIIIGQFGWIGLLIFVYILFALLIFSIQRNKRNVYFLWSVYLIFIYEFVASMSESAFFYPVAALLFFLLGLIVNISLNEASFTEKTNEA